MHAGVWNVGEIRMPRRFANDIAEQIGVLGEPHWTISATGSSVRPPDVGPHAVGTRMGRRLPLEVAQREARVAQRLALEPENQAWMSGPRL